MKKLGRTAKEIIAALDSTEQMCGTCRFSDTVCDGKLRCVFDDIRKFVELHVPKDTGDSGDMPYPYGKCPNCDYEFNSELVCEYEIKFCPNCGQCIEGEKDPDPISAEEFIAAIRRNYPVEPNTFTDETMELIKGVLEEAKRDDFADVEELYGYLCRVFPKSYDRNLVKAVSLGIMKEVEL